MYLTTKTTHFIRLDIHKVKGISNYFINTSLFQLFLIVFLIALNEVKAQVIVPDFQVAAVSDTAAPSGTAIAADTANNFIITYSWHYFRYHQPIGPIIGQQYDCNGINQGEKFIASENITRGSASIDMDNSGNFIVCWGGPTVYFQRFNNNHEAQDSNVLIGAGDYTDVGVDGTGNFIIIWELSDTIYFQRYNADGIALGYKTKVSYNPEDSRSTLPRIGFDSSGNFVIVWQNIGYDFIHSFYQRYNSNGEPQGNNIKVNGDTEDTHQSSPAVSVDKNGNFVIVWMDNRNGEYDIYCQRYNSNGEAQGNNIKVNDDINNSYQESPVIAIDESGKIIIIWSDNRNGNSDIYGQRYNSSGEAIGNNFRINHMEEGNKGLPDVALKNGRIYSTWHFFEGSQNDGIWANVLDFDNPVGVDSPEIENQVPKIFKLNQNYPNPFNPETTIEYELPYQSFILLKIYNMLGQEVRTLVKEHQQAGVKTVIWNGESNTGMQVPSGIYIYRMEADRFVKTQKMILIR